MQNSPAYLLGAATAARLYGLEKIALSPSTGGKGVSTASHSSSSVAKVKPPKPPGATKTPSTSIKPPKMADPTTTGPGALTNNDVANATFSAAASRVPGSKVASSEVHPYEKIAGGLGLLAKAPAIAAKAPALVTGAAKKGIAMLGGKKGLAAAATSTAASAAGDAVGRAM